MMSCVVPNSHCVGMSLIPILLQIDILVWSPPRSDLCSMWIVVESVILRIFWCLVLFLLYSNNPRQKQQAIHKRRNKKCCSKRVESSSALRLVYSDTQNQNSFCGLMSSFFFCSNSSSLVRSRSKSGVQDKVMSSWCSFVETMSLWKWTEVRDREGARRNHPRESPVPVVRRQPTTS